MTKEQLRINPGQVHEFLLPQEHRAMFADVMARVTMGQMLTRSQLLKAQESMEQVSRTGVNYMRGLIQHWHNTTKTYGNVSLC